MAKKLKTRCFKALQSAKQIITVGRTTLRAVNGMIETADPKVIEVLEKSLGFKEIKKRKWWQVLVKIITVVPIVVDAVKKVAAIVKDSKKAGGKG